MYRNLSKRIRGNGPRTCPRSQGKLWEILDICLRDQRQTWTLGSDVIYSQLQPMGNSEDPETIGTQQMLINLARTRIGAQDIEEHIPFAD